MHHFFLPPSWIQGDEVTITGPQARQIFDVLRLRPGDSVIVLDDSGWEAEVRLLSVTRHAVRGEAVSRRLSTAEPRTKVHLHQGMLKGQRFEFVLQKGTELGIAEFAPLISERCVITAPEAVAAKRARWEAIIQEAAEQSRRGRKPVLRPAAPLPQVCKELSAAPALALFLWEEGGAGLREVLREGRWGSVGDPAQRGVGGGREVHLLVGPEGGFTPQEVELARRHGLVPVYLGPRILRSETAGIVAAAVVLYELEDLG